MTNRRIVATLTAALLAFGAIGPAAEPALAAPGDVWFLNRTADGARPTGDASRALPDTSRDGSLTVFATSQALDPTDDNAVSDVYLWDKAAGRARRISATPTGAAPNDTSWLPAISGDGRFVVYTTRATDVVAGTVDVCAENRVGCGDVIRLDLATMSTELLTPPVGLAPDVEYLSSDVSGDGNVVAILELRPTDGRHARVWSVAVGLDPASFGTVDRNQIWPESTPRLQVSTDGSAIAFDSADQLLPADVDGDVDVYRADRLTHELSLASAPHPNEYPDLDVRLGGVTADGSVLYESATYDCGFYGMCDWWSELFVRDPLGRRTSVARPGRYFEPNGHSDISDDGRYIAWGSRQFSNEDVAWGDTGPSGQRIDRHTGTTQEIAVFGSLSGDGSHVAGLHERTEPSPIVPGVLSRVGFLDAILAQIDVPAPPPPANDLALRPIEAASPIKAGATTIVRARVGNAGSGVATGATVRLSLDPLTSIQSVSPGCTMTKQVVRCSLPSLSPGGVAEVSAVVSYRRAGTAEHRATLEWAPDEVASNDAASATVDVVR